MLFFLKAIVRFDPVLVIPPLLSLFAMSGGQAAYDLMVKNIPGMKKSNESNVPSEISELPALSLNWMPSLDEVEHEHEHGLGGSGEDDGASLWRRLMDAPPLGQNPMEKPLAIEDQRMMLEDSQLQLALEDAPPDLTSDGFNGKSSPYGHDGLKSDVPEISPHGQDGLKSDESNGKSSPHDGPDGLKTPGIQGVEVPNGAMVKRENEPAQQDLGLEEPSKKRKKTFASRYRPTALERGLKWDAIRAAFDQHIYPKIYSPSTVEDGFYKMCMEKMPALEEKSKYEEVAQTCAVMWLKDNEGLLK